MKAGAAFLTGLNENNDAGRAWAWMIRRYMIMDALFGASDDLGNSCRSMAMQLLIIIEQSQLIRQGLKSTESEA